MTWKTPASPASPAPSRPASHLQPVLDLLHRCTKRPSPHSAVDASTSLSPSHSQSVLDLINRCCELDPAKRPTAKQVVLALEGGSATPTSPEVRGALV